MGLVTTMLVEVLVCIPGETDTGLVITTSVEVQVCILEEIVQADSTGPVTRTTGLTIIDPDTGPVIDQATD
jgi:hypothetical protein